MRQVSKVLKLLPMLGWHRVSITCNGDHLITLVGNKDEMARDYPQPPICVRGWLMHADFTEGIKDIVYIKRRDGYVFAKIE